MITPKKSSAGFTLIELLTVIAIIGILAALTASTLPRVLEKARVTKLNDIFRQIRTILVEYSTATASYPPGYGYVDKNAYLEGFTIAQLRAVAPMYRISVPYLSYLDAFRNFALYDPFSTNGSDTNRNGIVEPMEFIPVGFRDMARGPDAFSFASFIYPDNRVDFQGYTSLDDAQFQLDVEMRPLAYFPVNKRHFERYRNFLFGINANDPRPRVTDGISPLSSWYAAGNPAGIRYPPVTYDAAVLISVGPSENTWSMLQGILTTDTGLTPADQANLPEEYVYHALGIMAYFMASRDADLNGRLDFDFTERTRNGEAKNPNNYLPGNSPNAYGPAIYVIDL